jgi:hypothetical protein
VGQDLEARVERREEDALRPEDLDPTLRDLVIVDVQLDAALELNDAAHGLVQVAVGVRRHPAGGGRGGAVVGKQPGDGEALAPAAGDLGGGLVEVDRPDLTDSTALDASPGLPHLPRPAPPRPAG